MLLTQRTNRFQNGRNPGFTLVELLFTSAMMTLAASLLLPEVQKVRELANEQNARQFCMTLADAAHQYHEQNGILPSVESPNNRFWQNQASAAGAQINRNGIMVLAGYQFQYSANADFYSIECQPVAPGLTGSRSWFLIGQAGVAPAIEDLVETEIPEADAIRQEAFDKIEDETKRSISQMYRSAELIDSGDFNTSPLQEGNISQVVVKHIDTDQNALIGIEELLGATSSVFPNRLKRSIRNHLQLGVGNEDVQVIPELSPEDLMMSDSL